MPKTYDSPWLIKNKYKKTICKFYEYQIVSKHFLRHLERRHKDEPTVKELLNKKPNCLKKKALPSLICNEGNLDDGLRGKIIPKKRKIGENINEKDFTICQYCRAFYRRLNLSRHVKKCSARPAESEGTTRPLAESYIYAACQKNMGKY
ncbi:hypothetical protein NQ314_007968 [Rhamnusium bicolor]|uniref:Uncharacterized protein n=1 Tax=Rhamnusium bicolor TaxID=1586634 RepID=A0AAV8YES5_9CUCU|nr:hypothetical protein NQ314_007968 [Rhamnusium bicolor]